MNAKNKKRGKKKKGIGSLLLLRRYLASHGICSLKSSTPIISILVVASATATSPSVVAIGINSSHSAWVGYNFEQEIC